MDRKTQDNYICNNKCCGYVTRREAWNNRKCLVLALKEVNEMMVRENFPGFNVKMVGSAGRNMIHDDLDKKRRFYDQDIQLIYTNTKNKVSDYKEFRNPLLGTLRCVLEKKSEFRFSIKNSTSVITIQQFKDEKRVASFDIALIDKNEGKILILDKGANSSKKDESIWNELDFLNRKKYSLKDVNRSHLKKEYLRLKCKNKSDEKNHKSSWNLFIEAYNYVMTNSSKI